MKTPEILQNLSPAEVTEKICASGLCDYGVFTKPIGEEIKALLKRHEIHPDPIAVTAGLNNNDFEHGLLGLLDDRADAILEGMQITAYALGAEHVVLQLPEGSEESCADAVQKAKERDIEVEYGIVDVRRNRHQMVMHFVAALSISEYFAGTYEEGAYVSVCRDGVCEAPKKVPYGTTIAEAVGEVPESRFFAVGQEVFRPDEIDTAITKDFKIGNGVIRFYPADCCIIQETEKELLRLRRESCGKCTFCREGFIQFHTTVQAIPKGQGQRDRLDIIREIGDAMTYSTQCSIGMQGQDFVVGTLDKFQKEYDDHIIRKKCEMQKCTAFQKIYIDPIKCTGCMDCMDVCDQDAIEGKAKYIHMIDEFECSLCGACIDACEEGAIIHTSERLPKLPTKLTKVGRFKKR